MENINNNTSERIVLRIPVELAAEEFAALCRIKPDSPAFEMLEETYPLIKQYGAPKAIIRWANVDGIEEDRTTIEGAKFDRAEYERIFGKE
ncbi:MAG: hypothetical protein IKR16_03655 [Firmicutes bacterium]|nr:hypothetical protein [Bacillota bacterium]